MESDIVLLVKIRSKFMETFASQELLEMIVIHKLEKTIHEPSNQIQRPPCTADKCLNDFCIDVSSYKETKRVGSMTYQDHQEGSAFP